MTPEDGDGIINNEDPDQNGLHSLPKPLSGSFIVTEFASIFWFVNSLFHAWV